MNNASWLKHYKKLLSSIVTQNGKLIEVFAYIDFADFCFFWHFRLMMTLIQAKNLRKIN